MAQQQASLDDSADAIEYEEQEVAPAAGRYATLLATRPIASLLATLALVVALSGGGYAYAGAPSFADASAGMESREDSVWVRGLTLKHLMQWNEAGEKKSKMHTRAPLIVAPAEAEVTTAAPNVVTIAPMFPDSAATASPGGIATAPPVIPNAAPAAGRRALSARAYSRSAHAKATREMCSAEPDRPKRSRRPNLRLVFEATAGAGARGLFAAAPLKAMCAAVQQFEAKSGFQPGRCAHSKWGSNWGLGEIEQDPVKWGSTVDGSSCCPARTVGQWIAHGQGVSCGELTDGMVDAHFARLQRCAPFYANGTLATCASSLKLCVYYQASTQESKYCGTQDVTTCERAVPAECTEGSAAYDIFHSLADSEFLSPAAAEPARSRLRYAQAYLHVRDEKDAWWQGDAQAELDKLVAQGPTGGAALVAFELSGDGKFKLFNKVIMSDAAFAGVAVVFVLLLLRSHSGSLLFSIAAMVQIVLSVPLSYFVYFVVFRMPFFPFLNMITVFLIVGIGADDTFVYVDTWKQSYALLVPRLPATGPASARSQVEMPQRVHWVLGRAASSMFVTTATTACAFFATAISSITAIRCFGIFAGIVVICDYMLMVSMLPCVVLLHHRFAHGADVIGDGDDDGDQPAAKDATDPGRTRTGPRWAARACARGTLCNLPADRTQRRWVEEFLVLKVAPFLTKARWVLVPALIAMGGVLMHTAFVDPGLQHPTTEGFQLFPDSHPMERYSKTYKREFRSESEQQGGSTLWASVLWGVRPSDNGNHLDPYDHGRLATTPLAISSPAAQRWLIQFEHRMRSQEFFDKTLQYQRVPLFGTMLALSKLSCTDNLATAPAQLATILGATAGYDPRNYTAAYALGRFGGSSAASGTLLTRLRDASCCGVGRSSDHIPTAATFDACVEAVATHAVGLRHNGEQTAFFFAEQKQAGGAIALGALKALRLEFKTNIKKVNSFESMDTGYKRVDNFVDAQVKSAPADVDGIAGLRAGFFISAGLEFYSLQRAVQDGARSSISFSLLLTFLVLLVCSRNLLATLCASVSIGLILSCVCGLLVNEGWELGVMESVCFMAAVGMCVDFVVHYTHAYTHSTMRHRHGRMADSLQQMGLSLFCGMLTTFLAGLVLRSFTNTLFNHQFGLFLMLCMSMSYIFATFFLLPLLSIIGPEGDFDLCPGWISLPARIRRCRSQSKAAATAVAAGSGGEASGADINSSIIKVAAVRPVTQLAI
eukprot:g52.t1